MIYKSEFEYLIMVLNDYISALPQSSRIAVGERVQHCIKAIEQGLTAPLSKADETSE